MKTNFEPHFEAGNDEIILECADKWLGFGKRSKDFAEIVFLTKFLRNTHFVCLVINISGAIHKGFIHVFYNIVTFTN